MKKLLKTIAMMIAALIGIAGLWLVIGINWPLSTPEPPQRPAMLLISGASVVDVENGQLLHGQDILIADGVIVEVGHDLDSEGADQIDATGQFLIPGLFDMHVHSIKLSPQLTHPLFVAAGVTAVRDMGGCMDAPDAWVACANDKQGWNAAVGSGVMTGPRYDQVTSLAINGGPEVPAGMDPDLGAASVAGARRRVSLDNQRGINFLKPYSSLQLKPYLALAQEAPEKGMYLAGHLPLAVPLATALESGQRSFEHAFIFIIDCYPGIEALRESDDPRAMFSNDARRAMIDDHDPGLCAGLQQKMAAAGSAYVPTHTTRKLDAFASDPEYRADPRLKYIPGPLKTLWLEDADAMAERGGEKGAEIYRETYEFGLLQTGRAHQAGVTVLAGTDAPDSFAFPGSGLHDELEHLVLAGLSPTDALRAATLDSAHFLGLEGRAGAIIKGARADLVLLRADPLQDISATRSVETVILAGAVYNRARIDSLLDTVEENASSWSMWPKFIWQLARSPVMKRQFAD